MSTYQYKELDAMPVGKFEDNTIYKVGNYYLTYKSFHLMNFETSKEAEDWLDDYNIRYPNTQRLNDTTSR